MYLAEKRIAGALHDNAQMGTHILFSATTNTATKKQIVRECHLLNVMSWAIDKNLFIFARISSTENISPCEFYFFRSF